MSEVVVAIISAAILVPEETMLPIQWAGAVAIVLAGLIEVFFGYTRGKADRSAVERIDADSALAETVMNDKLPENHGDRAQSDRE